MSKNTEAKAGKQSVAKIVHIEFTDKQRASLMPLVEELRKAQQEDKITVTIGQLDACFWPDRGYTSAWFTILHEEVGKQVLAAFTPIFRGLKKEIVNELDDEPEWYAEERRDYTQGAIPSPLWTENQRQAALIAQLRAELAAERERAERAEGEAAGLRAGYADLQAAVERAGAENALLRMGIAGITAHGGGWAKARIKEALDE